MTKEDAISRAEALKIVDELNDGSSECANIRAEIEKLPSIQSKVKTGHWIMTSDYLTTAYGSIDYVKCSCCGEESLEEGDYCPNCGCRMVEPQESEE